eukprot:TRINITY_DN8610_c0_g1_i1.p1 TRINITY_DN8610_c0_g1~~TRINITY_DN8610_c0_g1_i1.p1  ORF type:complete len:742 (-),score=231.36 TRINITY_DN8610_c0_g1_i1:82-2307(-)
MDSKYLIGEIGKEYIKDQLASETPHKFISAFQKNNALKEEYSKESIPVMNFVDLLEIKRSELYSSLMQTMKKNLLNMINHSSKEKLTELLTATFPYLGYDELKEIPFAAMKKLGVVPPNILKSLQKDTKLQNFCPLEVKRQIWQVDDGLFRQQVFPIISSFLRNDKVDSFFYEIELQTTEPKEIRNNTESIQKLAEFVGDSILLYNNLLHLLRTLFNDTGDPHFCALRSGVLMSMHDKDNPIVDKDPCHEFAWIMDAYIRDNELSTRQIKEIQNYFEEVKNKNEDGILGDLAMIIANPSCIQTIVRNIHTVLMHVVQNMKIPSKNEILVHLTELLEFALSARAMISNKKYIFPRAQKEIIQEFYPLMASEILSCEELIEEEEEEEEEVKEEKRKKLEEEEEKELPENFQKFFLNSPTARKVVLFFVVNKVREGKLKGLKKFFKMIHLIRKKLSTDEYPFSQSLVTAMLSTKIENVHANKLREITFEQFFLNSAASQHERLHAQALRYIIQSHAKLNIHKVLDYLKFLTSLHHDKNKMLPHYSEILETFASRINEENARFLFDYYCSQDSQNQEPKQEILIYKDDPPASFHEDSPFNFASSVKLKLKVKDSPPRKTSSPKKITKKLEQKDNKKVLVKKPRSTFIDDDEDEEEDEMEEEDSDFEPTSNKKQKVSEKKKVVPVKLPPTKKVKPTKGSAKEKDLPQRKSKRKAKTILNKTLNHFRDDESDEGLEPRSVDDDYEDN